MAIETSFTEELLRFKYSDDRFLTLIGSNNTFNLAFLNVKDRVGEVSLGKNGLTLPIVQYRFPLTDFGEKFFGIECDAIALVYILPVHNLPFLR